MNTDPAVLRPGDQLPTVEDGPLTRTDFVRYQGASGDMNKIHHDDGYAREAGFPSVFAVGMRQAGVLGTYLADTFGPDSVRAFAVRFREQAWPGDVISYRATVTDRRRDGADELLDLELTALRQTGAAHLTGTATVVVTRGQTRAPAAAHVAGVAGVAGQCVTTDLRSDSR